MSQKLNIINLPERTDRLADLKAMLSDNGITDYKIWPGIREKKSKLGIFKAHKQIVRDAKEQGLPFVHIGEDDIRFFKKGAWEYYLMRAAENSLDGCDIFFSMIYAGRIEDGKLVSTCSGMTMYTVYKKFYDFFLAAPEEKGGVHVDRYITSFYDAFDMRVCDPFVCEQTGSRSDNTKMKTDYTPLLRSRNLFGK